MNIAVLLSLKYAASESRTSRNELFPLKYINKNNLSLKKDFSTSTFSNQEEWYIKLIVISIKQQLL